jgi:hypothetical protein
MDLLLSVVGGLIVAGIGATVVRTRARLSRGNPLEFTVELRHWAPWFVVLPGDFADRAEVERLANDGGSTSHLLALLAERGGVDYRQTKVHVSLRCTAREGVDITRVYARVVRRDTPLSGSVVGAVPEGEPDELLLFDLDSRAREIPAWSWGWLEQGGVGRVGDAPYYETHHTPLKYGDTHTLYVVGEATREYCQWRVYVETRVGRRRRTITVDNDGLPFVTSGGASERCRVAPLWYWMGTGRFVDPDSGGWYSAS